VHPELSKLVPVYRQFFMEVQDDPNWRSRLQQEPLFKPGLATGMQTWSADGKLVAPPLPGLSQEEIARGHTFVTSWPSVYVVGHADYVRIVRLTPRSATETELQAQWLFAPDTLANPDFDPAAVAAFAETVMMQDAAVAEINQRGQSAVPHQAGVLLPEEYEVFAFQQWVRKQLSE
jgi:Rieske 2Fe-2S family protein